MRGIFDREGVIVGKRNEVTLAYHGDWTAERRERVLRSVHVLITPLWEAPRNRTSYPSGFPLLKDLLRTRPEAGRVCWCGRLRKPCSQWSLPAAQTRESELPKPVARDDHVRPQPRARIPSKNRAPALGNAIPVLGVKPKRGWFAFCIFFKIGVRSAMSTKRFRRELSTDGAKLRYAYV